MIWWMLRCDSILWFLFVAMFRLDVPDWDEGQDRQNEKGITFQVVEGKDVVHTPTVKSKKQKQKQKQKQKKEKKEKERKKTGVPQHKDVVQTKPKKKDAHESAPSIWALAPSSEEDDEAYDRKLIAAFGRRPSSKTPKKQKDAPHPTKDEKDEKDEEHDTTMTPFQKRMAKRLEGGRFRALNEMMYKSTGSELFSFFRENAEEYKEYIKGFRSQSSRWPLNPVDRMIEFLRSQPAELRVADLGCGEAKIAHSVPNDVASFDLVALNDRVTVADMADVPLSSGSVDVVIFCLSLMNTNYMDALREAYRILTPKGAVKIAEVQSRIENLSSFIDDVEGLGFRNTSQDTSNTMFAFLDFVKTGKGKGKGKGKRARKDEGRSSESVLKPCKYKKR